jgi:hypothetical protein
MKMLNQGEILTLNDNKKYSVVFSTTYNNENYVYLIDQDDYTNTMFCEYDNENGLEEVSDSDILENLMKLFVESQKN